MKVNELIIAILVLHLTSCMSNNQQDLKPKVLVITPSTTSGINQSATLSKDINPILNKYSCLSCHDESGASGGGISLVPYINLKKSVDDGSFLGCVVHTSGYSPMPKGGGKLNEYEISKIKLWIENKAPND